MSTRFLVGQRPRARAALVLASEHESNRTMAEALPDDDSCLTVLLRL